MFVSIIKIYPEKSERRSIIEVFDSLQGLVLSNPECFLVSVMTEAGIQGAVTYVEQWHTRDAFLGHLRSSLFSQVLEVMELSAIQPEISFYDAELIGGLDVVEQARGLYAYNNR